MVKECARSPASALTLDDLPEGVHKGPWAVCGVGLLPGDKKMSDVLHEQEFLYTVSELRGLQHGIGR